MCPFNNESLGVEEINMVESLSLSTRQALFDVAHADWLALGKPDIDMQLAWAKDQTLATRQHCTAMARVVAISGDYNLAWLLARNKSLSLLSNADEIVCMLLASEDGWCGLAWNDRLADLPNAPSLGMKLASESDPATRCGIASNPQLTALPNAGELVAQLLAGGPAVRRFLASNSCLYQLPDATRIVWQLVQDSDDSVGKALAANAALYNLECLPDVVDQLPLHCLQLHSLPVARLVESGYQLSSLVLAARSPKRFCRALIGTAHPHEVAAMLRLQAHFIDAMSGLHSLFMNPRKRKMDRAALLRYLPTVTVQMSAGLGAVPGDQLLAIRHCFNDSVIFDRALDSQHSDDTLRNMSVLLQTDHTTALMNRRLKRWRNNQETTRQWHDYCANAAERYFGQESDRSDSGSRTFPQADKADAKLVVSEAGREFDVEVPRHATDLKRLGKRYRHCVGGSHYVKQAIAGDIFFAINYRKAPEGMDRCAAKGIMVHAAPNGSVLQVNGFANGVAPDAVMRRAIRQAAMSIVNGKPRSPHPGD